MKLSSLLLCEDVRKEIMGTHTIVGQFNALRGFLMEKYTFKVFFTLTNFFGVGKLKIVVRSPEGVELKKFFTDDIPCVSREECYAGYFTVNDLFLRSYGRYTVSVYDMDGNELGTIGMNYLVHDFKTNQIIMGGKPVEVPRVNFHDNKELQKYAKLFLRRFEPLSAPFESIEFHSQFMSCDGIGSVSRHIVSQMVKKGIKVNLKPTYADQDSVEFIKSIPKESICDEEADIAIVNTLPPHLKNASDAKRLLLFSYWEASEINAGWVNVSNTVDSVFVPSKYVKNIYESSGVKTPILVYKQPIDPLFKYEGKETAKDDKEYFDVLFLGTCIPRKGTDIFLKAVNKVFGKDKKVRIRIHVKPWSPALGDNRSELLKGYQDNSQYYITSNVMSTPEIVHLLQKSDLLVAPSRSEGLGLIPIQSVICGTPAIVPNHSGFLEYNTTPGFLKVNKYKEVKGEGIYKDGFWFEPDFDELCDLLVFAKNNKDMLDEDAKKGSSVLSDSYGVVPTYSALESLINNIYVR